MGTGSANPRRKRTFISVQCPMTDSGACFLQGQREFVAFLITLGQSLGAFVFLKPYPPYFKWRNHDRWYQDLWFPFIPLALGFRGGVWPSLPVPFSQAKSQRFKAEGHLFPVWHSQSLIPAPGPSSLVLWTCISFSFATLTSCGSDYIPISSL